MKNIVIAIICLFLSLSLSFAEPEYSVSGQTINDIIQLKHRMDTHAQGAFEDSKQYGSERRDRLKKVLNYTSIISGNLKSLLSILGLGDLEGQEEQPADLTPREVNKFIDYVILRIDAMVTELSKYFSSSSDALMIHHAEMVNSFLKEGKRILEMVQIELNQL